MKIGSSLRRALTVMAVTAGLGAGFGAVASAQDTPVPKDDALDSLLEKLSEPSERTRSDIKEGPSAAKKDDQAAKKQDRATKKAGEAAKGGSSDKGAGAKDGTKPGAKPGDSGALSGKDQEVDELLQKLGETTETPSPEDRPRGGAGGGEKEKGEGGGASRKPQQEERSRLSGRDKETDEHLEELTGRRRRKRDDGGERGGPAGQIIKEMRDIEQKLTKPDTGEQTREEQKKVVKEIETLIEEIRKSGSSSMGRLVMRRGRRPGQQPGQQPGSTEGAMARGAPPTKPLPPTTKHSNAGGKDIWGHLPAELRQEIDNMTNELPLETKRELIDRYYLSVGKRKVKREESP